MAQQLGLFGKVSAIRSRNRYDGAPIYVTEDCGDCPYRAHGKNAWRLLSLHHIPGGLFYLLDASTVYGFCVWGVAVKLIVEHTKGKSRLCAKLQARSPVGVPRWFMEEQ